MKKLVLKKERMKKTKTISLNLIYFIYVKNINLLINNELLFNYNNNYN